MCVAPICGGILLYNETQLIIISLNINRYYLHYNFDELNMIQSSGKNEARRSNGTAHDADTLKKSEFTKCPTSTWAAKYTNTYTYIYILNQLVSNK